MGLVTGEFGIVGSVIVEFGIVGIVKETGITGLGTGKLKEWQLQIVRLVTE